MAPPRGQLGPPLLSAGAPTRAPTSAASRRRPSPPPRAPSPAAPPPPAPPRRVGIYQAVLGAFLGGPGSASAIQARLTRIEATLGDALPGWVVEELGNNAVSRTAGIAAELASLGDSCPLFTD